MKKKAMSIFGLVILCLSVFSCSKQQTTTTSSTGPTSEPTIEEKLGELDRVKDLTYVTTTDDFEYVYNFCFEQYIDHTNKELGTFTQKCEFGFNGFDAPNVLVTSGYYIYDDNYEYSSNENEIAFLLHSNYIFVEHRYFGESLPVEIDYYDVSTWDYLTTKQAADDVHDIYLEFSKILSGKWVASGISKGGITATLYAYYYPGDMDLYVPYVAPFIDSIHDTRWVRYINEEIGDIYYGEEVAAEMRATVLQFQVKLMEYKEILAPLFFQDALDSGVEVTEFLTPGIAYDMAVGDCGFAFWQYYQHLYPYLKEIVDMPEESEEEITAKQEQFYVWISGLAAINYGPNDPITPYFIQAYQELGATAYDFSYIRAALGDRDLFSVQPEEEQDLFWRAIFNDGELQLPRKELMAPYIEEMLRTTNDNFIIIYGSSDPFYSMRTADVVGRPNISIYVDDQHAHQSTIQTFDEETMEEIINKIKTILEIN